jgi:hypothetical protein
MKTIAQRFVEFQRMCMSPHAPAIQRAEMCIAFFAGAKSMLDAGIEIADLSDDDGVRALETFHRECRAFGEAHGYKEI